MLRGLSIVLIRILAVSTFIGSWSYWSSIFFFPDEPIYYLYATIPTILSLCLWILAIPISNAVVPGKVSGESPPAISADQIVQSGTFFIGLFLAFSGFSELMIFVPEFLSFVSRLAAHHTAEWRFDPVFSYYDYKLDSFSKLIFGVILMVIYRRFGRSRQAESE